MNTLGSGSSGRSAAIIAYSLTSESCVPLLQYSFDAFLRFQDEVGATADYEPIGCLVLAGAEGAPELRHRHGLLHESGIDSRLIDHDEINRLTPGLNLEDIEIGLYNPREGAVDPHCIMMGYAQYARSQGVEFTERVRALGLRTKGDYVVGVDTSAGPIDTRCVVNAAGFRAKEVAAWASLDLPITNVKRHIFCTGPVPAYSESIPFTYETELPWYIRREGPGLLIGMGSEESDEDDPQVDWSFLDTVIEHSLHRAPPLEDAGVKSGWAGLRPITPDEDPILGPVPHLGGYFNDCGWGGQGIMHAPAGGLILAEWIVDGAPNTTEASAFSAERFDGAVR
jgi:sarcosine oxidase subunit beta